MGSIECAVVIEDKFDAPIDKVWALVSDFGGIAKRIPGLKNFVLDGAGAGAVRSFQIGDGPVIRERLEMFEPQNYRFAYSLLPPAFMENYLGEIALTASETGGCAITWSGACTVPTAAELPERRAFLENTYRNGIAAFRLQLASA